MLTRPLGLPSDPSSLSFTVTKPNLSRDLEPLLIANPSRLDLLLSDCFARVFNPELLFVSHVAHVNGWEPAAYMSYMSQNFRLFHCSNLSVVYFRIFLLVYPESVFLLFPRAAQNLDLRYARLPRRHWRQL